MTGKRKGGAPRAAAASMAKQVAVVPTFDALIEDLVAASRILAMHQVLDAFGHVSVRHPERPDRFLLSRSLAPELVTAADIMEFDADSEPVDSRGRKCFVERFIHGEVYRRRPDVHAVVHSHSPTVVPYTITGTALKPVYHMSAFLHAGTPLWDIRKVRAKNDMLVRDRYLGAALAGTLGDKPLALMRGHGNVVVGPDVRLAVYRAIYCEQNARLQLNAKALGGRITFLSMDEARAAEQANIASLDRPWELWKKKAMAGLR